jgi:hypothetical protein
MTYIFFIWQFIFEKIRKSHVKYGCTVPTSTKLKSHSNLLRRHQTQLVKIESVLLEIKHVDRWKQSIHDSEITAFCQVTPFTPIERYNSISYPEHRGSISPRCWYVSTRLMHPIPGDRNVHIHHYKNNKSHIPRIYLFYELWGKNSKHTSILGGGGLAVRKWQKIACLTFLLESAEKLNTEARWIILGTTWTCDSCMLDHTWQ